MQGTNPSRDSSWFVTPTHITTINIGGHALASFPRTPGISAAALEPASQPIRSLVEGSEAKKRKVERACDFCRRRKTKCDGPKRQAVVCTNCAQSGRSCTYIESSKPRGPPKAYITGLEDRVEKMEALLKRLRPEADFSAELGPPIARDSWREESPVRDSFRSLSSSNSSTSRLSPAFAHSRRASLVPPAPTLQTQISAGAVTPYSGEGPSFSSGNIDGHRPLSTSRGQSSVGILPMPPADGEDDLTCSSDDEDYGELSELSLIKGMRKMTLNGAEPLDSSPTNAVDSQWRFHGKSSALKLISAARKLQQRHKDVSAKSNNAVHNHVPLNAPSIGMRRRERFWKSPSWELEWEVPEKIFPAILSARFPPMDLAESLVNIYFAHTNTEFPLLHRPTFNRQWARGLYAKDAWFGCLCMSIFGLASLWSDDPRVVSGSEPSGKDYVEAALAVHHIRGSVMLPCSLMEVQTYSILGFYFRSTANYPAAWTFVSIGIRKAQDVGAHRKKMYARKPSTEEELWKRAFWHLVAFDRIGSLILGRPCGTKDEDFDLDLPLEVDDQYWEPEDPEQAFRQPSCKPSVPTSFVCWIKMSQIASFALRTLYAIGKSQAPLGLDGAQWREELVDRMKQALSEWLDALPEHLRWSPRMEDPLFADQATTLFLCYHLIQIVVHRPFIPRPKALASSNFVSHSRHDLAGRPDFGRTALSVCLNAAKASAYILESQASHGGYKNSLAAVNCTYICAGVVLVDIWQLTAKMMSGAPFSTGAQAELLERRKDSVAVLSKFMARLEELSPRFEVARAWLQEIRASLPADAADTFPFPATSPSHQEGPWVPTSHDGSFNSNDSSQQPVAAEFVSGSATQYQAPTCAPSRAGTSSFGPTTAPPTSYIAPSNFSHLDASQLLFTEDSCTRGSSQRWALPTSQGNMQASTSYNMPGGPLSSRMTVQAECAPSARQCDSSPSLRSGFTGSILPSEHVNRSDVNPVPLPPWLLFQRMSSANQPEEDQLINRRQQQALFIKHETDSECDMPSLWPPTVDPGTDMLIHAPEYSGGNATYPVLNYAATEEHHNSQDGHWAAWRRPSAIPVTGTPYNILSGIQQSAGYANGHPPQYQ